MSNEKADYVRAAIAQTAGRAAGHTCHWPGCAAQVPPASWGCSAHWYKLPLRLRNKVWAAFRPGQEKTKTPSARYLEVAREVREWIKENHGADKA